MNRDGRVPDLNPLIAEILGSRNKAGFSNQRQADKLTGDAFHAGCNIGYNRRINKTIGQKKRHREIGNQPYAKQHV